MNASLPPLLVRPHYVPKPWGGRRLATLLGRDDLPAGPVGESWEVVDADGLCSLVEGGPHDGRRLRDVLGEPFPLLLKVLDAQEDLSIQVHPDGHDDAPPKEEAWVALAPDGAVATGDVAALARAGADALPRPGHWLEHLVRTPLHFAAEETAQPPSLVHVPPGTVHCILAGSLLFEVQNPVDITWRLDDYGRVDVDGRARPLHADLAFDVLVRGALRPATPSPGEQRLRGRHFQITLGRPGRVQVKYPRQAAFFLERGTVSWEGGQDFAVPAGRTVVLPSTTRSLTSIGWMILVSA